MKPRVAALGGPWTASGAGKPRDSSPSSSSSSSSTSSSSSSSSSSLSSGAPGGPAEPGSRKRTREDEENDDDADELDAWEPAEEAAEVEEDVNGRPLVPFGLSTFGRRLRRTVRHWDDMHPRNPYRGGPLDLAALAAAAPDLEPFLLRRRPRRDAKAPSAAAPTSRVAEDDGEAEARPSEAARVGESEEARGPTTEYVRVDWRNPGAQRAVTRALLRRDFGVADWGLPPDRMCPPVPSRVNYLLWIEDLLADRLAPRAGPVRGIDFGTGASCIFPLLGHARLGWHFLALDADPVAVEWASRNASTAGGDAGEAIRVIAVEKTDFLVGGLARAGASATAFDFLVCNPPFFESMDEAKSNPRTVCTGCEWELACDGGEQAFVGRLIEDSLRLREQVTWYTSMLGKRANLEAVTARLQSTPGIRHVRTTTLKQGVTVRWAVAWSFEPYLALRATEDRGAVRGSHSSQPRKLDIAFPVPDPVETTPGDAPSSRAEVLRRVREDVFAPGKGFEAREIPPYGGFDACFLVHDPRLRHGGGGSGAGVEGRDGEGDRGDRTVAKGGGGGGGGGGERRAEGSVVLPSAGKRARSTEDEEGSGWGADEGAGRGGGATLLVLGVTVVDPATSAGTDAGANARDTGLVSPAWTMHVRFVAGAPSLFVVLDPIAARLKRDVNRAGRFWRRLRERERLAREGGAPA